MKTIGELKSKIDLTKIENKYELTEKEMLEVEVKSFVMKTFTDNSEIIGQAKKTSQYQPTNYVYSITNEEIINTLRNLYKISKNNFLKDVIVSVGKSKIFTDKQLEIISEAISLENNLIITI
jgi:hypothetical protein